MVVERQLAAEGKNESRVGMGREKGKTQDKQAVALLVYCTLRSLKPPL